MRNTAAIFALAALCAVGCVKKSTYQKMKKDLQAQIAERDQKIVTLEEALATEQKKVKDLETKIAGLEGELEQKNSEIESLTTERQRLENELASVVKDRARLEASAEELKKAVEELGKRKAEAEKRVAQFRALLAKFKQLIDSGKLRVKIVDGRMVLELPSDVLFASGKAELSDEGKVSIQSVAAVLVTIGGRQFQVEGHTDNVPIKTRHFPSNWELASARALNVVKAMVEVGMPGEYLSAASFAEFKPVKSNDTEQGRAANRRIEIVIVPDLSSLPGFDELNAAVGS